MESGIYQIRNLINGKIYVGSAKKFTERWKRHISDLRRGNHSSIKLQRAFNKYGEINFEFSILELMSYEKTMILKMENFYISSLNSKNNGYNIADASFGDVLSTHPNREQIIKKISDSTRKRMLDFNERMKTSRPGELNGMYGRTHSEEAKKKMSIANLGNKYCLGKIRTESTRKKLSELAKERVGEKNSFYGKTHSKESKQKISNARIGKSPANRRPVMVNGVIYTDLTSAYVGSGIKVTTIWHRIKSKNVKYIDTYYLDEPKN